MHPSQALETWWHCTNTMPELAGCVAVTERVLALPTQVTSPADRGLSQPVHQRQKDRPINFEFPPDHPLRLSGRETLAVQGVAGAERPEELAPERGLEPLTRRLTAGCSTIELLWNSESA